MKEKNFLSLIFDFSSISHQGKLFSFFFFFLEIKNNNKSPVNVEEFGEVSDEECKDRHHMRSETPNLTDQLKRMLESGDVVSDRNNVEQRLRDRIGLCG